MATNNGDFDPFFDEHAQQHPWNPEFQAENLTDSYSNPIDSYGNPVDAYGNPIDPSALHPDGNPSYSYNSDFPEVDSQGTDQAAGSDTWGQDYGQAFGDGNDANSYGNDWYTGNPEVKSDFVTEDEQGGVPEKDNPTFSGDLEEPVYDSRQKAEGTNYEEFNSYFAPSPGSSDGGDDSQFFDTHSDFSPEEEDATAGVQTLGAERGENTDSSGFAGDAPVTPAQIADSHPIAAEHIPQPPNHETSNTKAPQSPKGAPTLDEISSGSAVLSAGHQGEAVEAIYELLGLEADKTFSAELAAAVSEFQESEGLQPTGVVDQVTLQALQDVEYDRLHPKPVTLKDGAVAVSETKNPSRQPSQSADPHLPPPAEQIEVEGSTPLAQESLLGNVAVAPNLEAGLQTVLGLLPPEVQKAVQGELKQLWDSTEKVPWLRDALGKAVQTAEQPLTVARRVASLWESLPEPLRDTVVSMIPLGDGLDLIDQTLKKLQGKPVDPVIVIMAGIGLGADAGWLDGIIPDPADAANFATGFLKGTYKAMNKPAKEILTKIVKKAEKNKEVLKEVVEKVGKLSKYAEVLAKHPNAVPYLLKLEKEELEKLVANPKLLEKAVEQSEVINKYTSKHWEQLSQTEQDEVKKFYRVYTNKKTKGKIFSQRENIGMRMHVDKDGIIKEGSLRNISPLRISTDQMRKRLKDANIEILEGHAIHHKIPITAAENDPLAKAARELGYDVNNVDNLKQLPGSSAARENLTDPLLMPEHGEKNFHPEWIKRTKFALKKALEKLVRDAGAPGLQEQKAVQYLLENGYEDEILKAMKKVEQTLEKDLLRDGVPWIKRNAAGEKVIATNTPESQETQIEVG
jgi:hypothetical protein